MKAFRWVGASAVAAAFAWQVPSDATVVRAVPLASLVESSDWIVLGTVTDQRSHYEEIGGVRRVVTDNTVQLDLPLTTDRSESNGDSEVITVRTLGGTLGSVAHVVLGEAVLPVGSLNLLFLRQGSDRNFHVTAMAQGQYVAGVDQAGELRLYPSPGLDSVVNSEQSAVAALGSRTLEEVETLVAENAGLARMVQ